MLEVIQIINFIYGSIVIMEILFHK